MNSNNDLTNPSEQTNTPVDRVRSVVLTKGEKWLNQLNERAEWFQPQFEP
jgi:hypothetical protein